MSTGAYRSIPNIWLWNAEQATGKIGTLQPGLVSYTMARTADGGISVTVCKDKKGTEESVRLAREWISANAGSIGTSAPAVSEGDVIVQITG